MLGVTKLEYIAIQAMKGLLSNPNYTNKHPEIVASDAMDYAIEIEKNLTAYIECQEEE